MKRIISITLIVLMCFSLCSCETILNRVKSAVTGAEISTPPADYLATLSNAQFEYELYKDYVKIIKYLAEETEVVIPSEIDNTPVTVIGELCFHQIEADVTSVIIPDSIHTIETKAFYALDSLLRIEIPDTVTSVGDNAFAWCSSLAEVKLGSGITEIPDYCFNSCPALVSVEIPDTIARIGLRAFSYCSMLSEITVPASVAEIGNRAFVGCPVLEFVIFENNEIAFGNFVFEDSEKVVLVASENSSAYEYCENNYLKWTSSKSVDPIQLGTPPEDSSAASSDSSEISQ